MNDSHSPSAFNAPHVDALAPLFPGYEIHSLIATGGMGAVYQAVQKSLDRVVAIKILPQEFSKDASFCAGFEAEAKAMARLNHPNLISVYDFGEVNGMLFIIMEYVPGQSLFHSSHGIAIDPGEVIRLVSSICSGLAHAHENGIIHRDIKPSNILLDLSAQPKIGDFGLARPVERKDQEGEEIFGTPHYTAPEVLSSPQSVGFRADIFSVGVLLHELLTGKLPADDMRPASVISHCDLRFDAIIRRATNLQPELRYSDATEIIKELRMISSPAGQRAMQKSGPPTPTRRTLANRAKAAKSKAAPSAITSLIWILSLGAFAVFMYFRLQNGPKVVVIRSGNYPAETPPKPPKEEPTAPPEHIPDTPPEPAPEPPPAPETDQQPITPPEPIPEPTPLPQLQPQQPEISVEPKLDVNGFYSRARKIMLDRVTPLVAARDKELDKNVDALKRNLNRLVRKIEYPTYQKTFSSRVDVYIDSCKANGNRIASQFTAKLAEIPEFIDVHKEFYDTQKSIDQTLVTEVSKLSATYIMGLQKQIERSKLEKDTPAISMIEQEIDLVRKNPSYFLKQMLGDDIALTEAARTSVEPFDSSSIRRLPF